VRGKKAKAIRKVIRKQYPDKISSETSLSFGFKKYYRQIKKKLV